MKISSSPTVVDPLVGKTGYPYLHKSNVTVPSHDTGRISKQIKFVLNLNAFRLGPEKLAC